MVCLKLLCQLICTRIFNVFHILLSVEVTFSYDAHVRTYVQPFYIIIMCIE